MKNKRDLFLAFVFILITWQLLALLLKIDILPGPIIVFRVFAEDLFTGELTKHFLISLERVIAGTSLAVVTAVPAGLVMGQSRIINRVFTPLVYLLYPIPKVVFVPIVLLFFGIGDFSKVIIIFIILFFQILVLVKDQSSNVHPELIRSIKSLGAGRKALFRYVYFPASLPAIFTALRQSVGTAVAVLYIAELYATNSGLGYYIYYQGSSLMNFPSMYAGILAMSLLGVGMYYAIELLERKMCPWLFVL